LLQDFVTSILVYRCFHHCTTERHSVIRTGVGSQAAMKFAGIDINVEAVLLEGFMHHPQKFFAKLISSRQGHRNLLRLHWQCIRYKLVEDAVGAASAAGGQ
jgi:hypothetical protein